MRKFILFFATGGGAGYFPKFPGTMGSLVGIFLFWTARNFPPTLYVITLLTFLFFSVWVADMAEILLNKKDAQIIVLDEVVGMMMTLSFLPISWSFSSPETIKCLILGFILFRVFDIWKPGPIRWIQDTMPGGWGVIGDDLAAGLLANLILQVSVRVYF